MRNIYNTQNMPGTWLALNTCELPPLLNQGRLWEGSWEQGQEKAPDRMAKHPLVCSEPWVRSTAAEKDIRGGL